MKKITIRLCRIPGTLLLLLFTCYVNNCSAQTPPSWGSGPGAPINTDLAFSTVNATPTTVETINCDMYADISTGTVVDHLYVIVWDEYVSGTNTWNVYLSARQNTFAAYYPDKLLVATNAKHPDVAIGDKLSHFQGYVDIGVVYETTTGTPQVMYKEILVSDLFGYGTSIPSSTGFSSAILVNADPTHDAHDPHIHALPRYQVTPSTYWTGTNPYQALGYFEVAWSEYDGSSDYEIWVDGGEYEVGVNGTPATHSIGTKPDIGVTLIDNTTPYAYVSYLDNSGDIYMDEFDLTGGTPTWQSTSAIQTSMTITSYPRIDATNVTNTGASACSRWAITAAVDNGQEEVRVYDANNGIIDLGSDKPYTTPGADGYQPAIAVGPRDDYNGLSSAFGNNYYVHASTINTSADHVYADAYDITANTFGNYLRVNSLAINTGTVGVNPPLAVGTCTNTGEGNMVAWYNYSSIGSTYQIRHKINTGSNFTFKPERPSSIVNTRQDGYDVYPNPAAKLVYVSGLKSQTTYMATDIAGRSVLQGKLNPSDAKIDISQLSPGVYIFNFNEAGTLSQLKLVKQ